MKATTLGGGYDIVESTGAEPDKNVYSGLNGCLEAHFNDKSGNSNAGGFTFIDGKTPKIICTIPAPNPDTESLAKQSTIHVTTQVEYNYEFRKEIKVTVEPKV